MKGLIKKCFYRLFSCLLRLSSFSFTTKISRVIGKFRMVFFSVFSLLVFSLFSFTSSASALDFTGQWGDYWQFYDCSNPYFAYGTSGFKQGFVPGSDNATLAVVHTCKNQPYVVEQNDIFAVDVYIVNGRLESFSPTGDMHLMQTEQISVSGDRTQYRLYFIAVSKGTYNIVPNLVVRSSGTNYLWVSNVVAFRPRNVDNMTDTNKILSDIRNMTNDTNKRLDTLNVIAGDIRNMTNDTNIRLDKVISALGAGTDVAQLQQINEKLLAQGQEQKKQTGIMEGQLEEQKKQTEQNKEQYEQEKAEEAEREESAKNDADSLTGIFNISFMNPFAGIWEMFNPGGCASIPTIAGWVNSKDTTYCSWWPQSIRTTLTPVFSLASMMLLFGFVIRWLGGSSDGLDKSTNITEGFHGF